LAGHNPDAYFHENAEAIRRAARYIHERAQVPRQDNVIYRGLLVPREKVASPSIAAWDHTAYLSFSRRMNLALIFADVAHPLSIPFMKMPGHEGYVGILCEDVVRESEVLFDYRWFPQTALIKLQPHFAPIVAEQHEIILENLKHPLRIVSQVPPGSTRIHWYKYPITYAHGMEYAK
jgi:hypothetical protein